jgi:hypothetical protein
VIATDPTVLVSKIAFNSEQRGIGQLHIPAENESAAKAEIGPGDSQAADR